MLLKALRAAASDLEHPHQDQDQDQGPATGPLQPPTSTSLADALLVIAEAFLAGKVAAADDPEVYQVIVHVGTDAITPGGPAADAGDVSAETCGSPSQAPDHPADPARCHVEDGPAISVTTAQMIACSSSWSWMLHDSAGKLLDLGRRRRRPNAALRRRPGSGTSAGAGSRAVSPAGSTCTTSSTGPTAAAPTLDNLVSLCKAHHRLVHERGYLIAAARDGTFAFYRPDGTMLPACPALPQADGTIGDCHDADITPETIIPPWYGERLDLDHAIYVCFANAANQANAASQASTASQDGSEPPPVPADPPDSADKHYEPVRFSKWAIEPQDWMPSLRREYTTA